MFSFFIFVALFSDTSNLVSCTSTRYLISSSVYRQSPVTAATLLCVFTALAFSGSDTQVWASTTSLHLALVQRLVGSRPPNGFVQERQGKRKKTRSWDKGYLLVQLTESVIYSCSSDCFVKCLRQSVIDNDNLLPYSKCYTSLPPHLNVLPNTCRMSLNNNERKTLWGGRSCFPTSHSAGF